MKHIINIFIVFIMLLTCSVILFYFLDQKREKGFIKELALSEARAIFIKDSHLYEWIAAQGGIYVLSSDSLHADTSSHKPNITLNDGKKLTLIHSTTLLRQVNALLMEDQKEIYEHITNLNPLSQENAPDEWEAKALLKLNSTKLETYSLEHINHQEYLRYMGAFTVKEACLKCHPDAKIGDIKGGMSVTLPLNNYKNIAEKRAHYSLTIYLFFWFFGFCSLGIAMYYLVKLLRKHHLLVEETHALQFLNKIDPLTKTFNRRVFENWLSTKIMLFQVHHINSCMIMIDIDFFKKINDTHGHLIGDKVLIEIAQIINNHVREEDCFARIGGEEFALLLFNTKIRRAYVIAERIRRMIADSKIKIHDGTQETVSVTISVGISTFTTYDTSIENIIARADEAMYLAKKEGRNKVKIEQ